MRARWVVVAAVAAWLAACSREAKVAAQITVALSSAQLALAAAGLGAASLAGLGLLVKKKKSSGESSYGPPEPSYGPPEAAYEDPEPTYEEPEPVYESPAPVYEEQDPSAPTYGSPDSYSAPVVPDQDEYGSPSAPALGSYPRRKRHRGKSTRHRPGRRAGPGLAGLLPRLGSYREYVARMQPRGARGRREARGQGARGRREADTSLDIDALFQEVSQMDAADCGKLYVCEVVAAPASQRTEGDGAVLALLQLAGARRGAARYRQAAELGAGARGARGCREAFPRCPVHGLSELVAATL